MSIIGSLPNNLTNGTTADATQVMANFSAIVNAVNNTSTGAASIPGVQASSYNYATDTGTVNNIIVGMTPSPAVYTDGTQGNFKAANTNTSTTVNIKYGSLGNKALVIDQAGTPTPIGSIISGMHYRTEYDSTQDKCILINPSSATLSFTAQLSGCSAGGSGTANARIDTDGFGIDFWLAASITGTSNSTSTSLGNIPAALQPTTSRSVLFRFEDNTANNNAQLATMVVSASSSFVLSTNLNSAGGNWTASGTKGMIAPGPHIRWTKD